MSLTRGFFKRLFLVLSLIGVLSSLAGIAYYLNINQAPKTWGYITLFILSTIIFCEIIRTYLRLHLRLPKRRTKGNEHTAIPTHTPNEWSFTPTTKEFQALNYTYTIETNQYIITIVDDKGVVQHLIHDGDLVLDNSLLFPVITIMFSRDKKGAIDKYEIMRFATPLDKIR